MVNSREDMNKKEKKKADEIKKRIARLKQQLKGEQEQPDDPDSIEWFKLDILKLQMRLDKLTGKK